MASNRKGMGMVRFQFLFDPRVSEQGLHLLVTVGGSMRPYCGYSGLKVMSKRIRDVQPGETPLCNTCKARLFQLREFHGMRDFKESPR